MKINEIKAMAKEHNLKPGKATKGEIIRSIQQKEGNTPCFDSNISQICGQPDCLWRADCH